MTQIISPSVDSTCQKSICARLWKYSWSGLWGWVDNVVESNRHESYELTEVCGHVLRTRKVHVSLFHGSWLPVGYAGWLKMLSIRVDLIESKQIVSPVVDSSCVKSSSDVTCESSQIVKCLDESTQFGCIGHGCKWWDLRSALSR